MSTRFDRDTAIERIDESTWKANIDTGWWIVAGPNGGYVAAILLRALTEAVADETRAPRSVNIHFVSPPAEGEVSIQVRTERQGRSLTTLSARMEQGGKLLALALAAFSRPRSETYEFDHCPMPKVPPAAAVAVSPSTDTVAMRERYEIRPCIGDGLFTDSGRALTGGWIRLEEPRTYDALSIGAIADAWPPAVFPMLRPDTGPVAIPTIDLSIHFREQLTPETLASDDFLLVSFESKVSREGFVEEDGMIWSPKGQLLALARQLAVVI